MIKTLKKTQKINRTSDENVFYMKVAQNDETNQNTQPVRPPHIPNIANSQLSPSGSFVQKCETPGILSRMFPPSPVPPRTTLGRTQHHTLSCHASSCICLHYIYCFFPLFSHQTSRPTPLLSSMTTVLTTPLSCQSNQASPPFDHQISPILISSACNRVVQHVTAFR